MKKANYPHTRATLTDNASTLAELKADMQTAGMDAQTALPLIEASLAQYPEYATGLPFADEDSVYAERLKTDKGLQLAQQYLDFWA